MVNYKKESEGYNAKLDDFINKVELLAEELAIDVKLDAISRDNEEAKTHLMINKANSFNTEVHAKKVAKIGVAADSLKFFGLDWGGEEMIAFSNNDTELLREVYNILYTKGEVGNLHESVLEVAVGEDHSVEVLIRREPKDDVFFAYEKWEKIYDEETRKEIINAIIDSHSKDLAYLN